MLDRLRSPVLVFDGAGLALFAVSGTQKALAYGLEPVMAALLGMLTGIGGGMVRDLLVTQIPTVLHAELYAVPRWERPFWVFEKLDLALRQGLFPEVSRWCRQRK